MTVECGRLIAHLQAHAVGRGHAWTAKQLGAVLDVSDRALRELAHEAAEAGVLICADNAGYFVPATASEVDETVGRLRSQAHEMLARASTLARLAHDRFIPKPASLFDDARTGVARAAGTTRTAREARPVSAASSGTFNPRGAFSSLNVD